MEWLNLKLSICELSKLYLNLIHGLKKIIDSLCLNVLVLILNVIISNIICLYYLLFVYMYNVQDDVLILHVKTS